MTAIDPQEFGEMKATVAKLDRHCEQISRQLTELTALANQERGAFWAVISLSGLMSAMMTWIASKTQLFAGIFK